METFNATILRLEPGSYRPRLHLGFVADSDPHWRADVTVDIAKRIDTADGESFADLVSTPQFRSAIEFGSWGTTTSNSQTCKNQSWYGNGKRFKLAAYDLANTFYQQWNTLGVCATLYARWQLDKHRAQEERDVWRKALAAYDGEGEPDFYPHADPYDSEISKRAETSGNVYLETGRLTGERVFRAIETWRDGLDRSPREQWEAGEYEVHDQARVTLAESRGKYSIELPGIRMDVAPA